METPITLFIAIIGSIIVIYSQIRINSSYNKYKRIKNNKRLSGQEVARIILDNNNLDNVHIVAINGELTDHYDQSRKVIRLSNKVFNDESIASLAVAAHECGHAIQDKENYTLMKIRTSLVPIVNFVSYTGYFVTIISLFMGIMTYLKMGILILSVTLLFHLVTLPVEINASKRALNELKKLNLIEDSETNDAYEMLKSAALTYVASLISTVLNLLRLILMVRDNDR